MYNKYYLISTGCCGTKAVLTFLKQSGLIRPQAWHSHRRNPNDVKAPPDSLVYLFANPYNSILCMMSRFNRGNAHIKNIGGDIGGYSNFRPKGGWNIESYLKHGKDFFMLENHFDIWYNSGHNVMFVKLERLPEVWPVILERWGMDPKTVDQGFELKERNSNWQQQPDNIKQGLQNMLGKFYARYQAFDDYFIND